MPAGWPVRWKSSQPPHPSPQPPQPPPGARSFSTATTDSTATASSTATSSSTTTNTTSTTSTAAKLPLETPPPTKTTTTTTTTKKRTLSLRWGRGRSAKPTPTSLRDGGAGGGALLAPPVAMPGGGEGWKSSPSPPRPPESAGTRGSRAGPAGATATDTSSPPQSPSLAALAHNPNNGLTPAAAAAAATCCSESVATTAVFEDGSDSDKNSSRGSATSAASASSASLPTKAAGAAAEMVHVDEGTDAALLPIPPLDPRITTQLPPPRALPDDGDNETETHHGFDGDKNLERSLQGKNHPALDSTPASSAPTFAKEVTPALHRRLVRTLSDPLPSSPAAPTTPLRPRYTAATATACPSCANLARSLHAAGRRATELELRLAQALLREAALLRWIAAREGVDGDGAGDVQDTDTADKKQLVGTAAVAAATAAAAAAATAATAAGCGSVCWVPVTASADRCVSRLKAVPWGRAGDSDCGDLLHLRAWVAAAKGGEHREQVDAGRTSEQLVRSPTQRGALPDGGGDGSWPAGYGDSEAARAEEERPDACGATGAEVEAAAAAEAWAECDAWNGWGGCEDDEAGGGVGCGAVAVRRALPVAKRFDGSGWRTVATGTRLRSGDVLYFACRCGLKAANAVSGSVSAGGARAVLMATTAFMVVEGVKGGALQPE